MEDISNSITAIGIGNSLRVVLSVENLRRLLRYPAWGFTVQLLNSTRAYDSGLSGAELLIEVIKSYESELENEELNNFLQYAYTLKLQMLDKMDLWNEYLSFWQELREFTDYEFCYSRRNSDYLSLPIHSLKNNKEENLEREDFIVRVENECIYVHWLYTLSHRYNVILRKQKRKQGGNSRKSDLHHYQLDLSENEIRRRLIEFERIISTQNN